MNPETVQLMLKESISRFLTDYRNGVTDFSNYTSISSRILQYLPDPPLEISWFYSALAFHSTNPSPQDSSQQISRVKDLFQLLVSCSSSYNADRKIAALAPVVSEFYSLVVGRKELGKEIDRLLEGIVSYISITRGEALVESDDGFEGLGSCFGDLVRVWVVGRSTGSCKFGEELRVFVPIVSDGVREGITVEGHGVGYLAGVVMTQAFLLRLYLRVESGVSRAKLEKDLVVWAVEMIKTFGSYYFVDILLKMLLEPVLPLNCVLNSESELFLRGILYNAVVTADYSFIVHQKVNQQPGGYLKNFALMWLFVTDNAIRFARENEDHTKIIPYTRAFSESLLVPQLITWVTNQPGVQSLTSTPNVSTPVSLIKWLLIVEDQGVEVFASDLSKIYAKAIICKSRIQYQPLVYISENWNLNRDHFYTNREGEFEDKVGGDLQMVDSIDARFSTTNELVKLTTSNGARKRKEGSKDEGDKQCKHVKCQVNDNAVRESVFFVGDEDGLTSGSEADNEACDGEIEYMEQ